MAVLMVPFFYQPLDDNGAVIPLGKIYTYAAGTDTPKATFTDFTEGVNAANPVVLDANGRATIWISGAYKFVLTDALDNIIRTTDNVVSFSVPAAGANAYFQQLSGDGVTVTFALSQDLGTDENAILGFVNNGGWIPQNPNAFTLTSGGSPTITFAVAPPNAANNIRLFAPSTLLGAASAAAAAAATSEANAAASELLASQWASQTSGIVDTTDFSAKAWAIGGTGVTGVSGKGASKEWATLTGALVDTADYSSKEYAIGTFTRGLSGGGSSKDWASYTGGTVDNVDYSAKYEASISTAQAVISTAQAVIATAAAQAAITASSALANQWLFAASTTMADPSTRNFRLNNATLGSVTAIALSSLSGDSGNPNLHSFIITWDDSNNTPRGVIRIEKNASNFIMLGVSGDIVDNTTWCQIPVTVIASSGSFTAADVTFVNFVQYGNNGTLTGTGTNGRLAGWTGTSALGNTDLTGDVTTTGGVATTIKNNVALPGSPTTSTQTAWDNSTKIATTAEVAATASTVNLQSKSADYTFVLADIGGGVFHPSSDNNARTFTIPANASVAFPVNTCLTFVNYAATACNVAITSDTMRQAGTTNTGTRSIAQYGMATAVKVTTTDWIINGSGIS